MTKFTGLYGDLLMNVEENCSCDQKKILIKYFQGLYYLISILAEDSPSQLLTIYGMNTLEDVFLRLCVKDDNKVANKISLNQSWTGIKVTRYLLIPFL